MGNAFDGIVYFIFVLIGLCIIFVPLGLWKLVEIIIWLFHHLHIGVS